MNRDFGKKNQILTPDYLQLTPFCRYFSFVAASSSSFSKIVFFALLTFWAGGIGYVSRSLWSIRGLRRFMIVGAADLAGGGRGASEHILISRAPLVAL